MPHFKAIPTEEAQAFRAGALDAHGNPPEHSISTGTGNPCRHCLKPVPEGAPMLILAYKPFAGTNPYAEVGPIFLCADACERGDTDDMPEIFTSAPDYLIKGYTEDDRIFYGTGSVTPQADMKERIAQIFENPDIAYIHVRSARNNCYQARVDRSESDI